MAVELELPVGPGRKPVLVVAVDDDQGVRPDAALLEELAELGPPGDVAGQPIGQLRRPVPVDGPGQVAALEDRGVDVDLHEADVRIVEVLECPVGGDECVIGVAVVGHGNSLRVGVARPARR
jgi:hypothetical protein